MKKTALLLVMIALTACNQAQEKAITGELLLSDVNVIDVREGTLLAHQHIVIDSGIIKHILSEEQQPENFNKHIDGTGKFVLPGLAEMHAHIPPPSTSQERLEETLFLYLSNGITTIRGMLGASSHLELREQVKKGEILGPRIFTSSPSFNGNSVTSEEEAITKVTAYQKDGYDFLKIHPGIQRNVFDALVKTANDVGIPFAGHVPVDVGIRHALESNFASIDHIDGYLEGLVPASEAIDPSANGFFGYNFTPLADVSLIDELVTLSKEHKVWIVPTQSLFERWFAPISAETLLAQPEMKYMPASTLENWKRIKLNSTGPDSGFDEEQWEDFIAIRRQLLKALQDNGQGILLGSDAPQLFNVPGFSIHHEIEGMVKAGMTPLEIIQSGTINPAQFFGLEHEFGEVKEGLAADLVVLESNPMDNLSALKDISGVIRQGNWLSQEMIALKLEKIAENASKN
ncbi:amidohydrolase family protein [Flagellimonas algicola]|uniref:Amidohydrolase family protein n=1 Tax=Flagellimonas algicola TaxID=2583815 RepID=A0ABY2WPX4_9FLAO|nr:amidohydrolase family protein [Allomuricauda algicola]TMU56963.1 amidohydrolase family protein [Allomuricauda algicola]